MRRFSVVAALSVLIGSVGLACSDGSSGPGSSGGTSATGGAQTGGANATGGSVSNGGATQTGGAGAGTSSAAGGAGFTCQVERPTECKQPATTYSQVAPIIAQRCVVCHGMKAGHWPLNAYDHIAHWADSVSALVSACAMPPLGEGGPIPVEEADQILNFIRCGLKKE